MEHSLLFEAAQLAAEFGLRGAESTYVAVAARTLFEESLGLSSRIGDKSGTGWALNNLGIIALVQGDCLVARA
jgi:hypothetical protein